MSLVSDAIGSTAWSFLLNSTSWVSWSITSATLDFRSSASSVLCRPASWPKDGRAGASRHARPSAAARPRPSCRPLADRSDHVASPLRRDRLLPWRRWRAWRVRLLSRSPLASCPRRLLGAALQAAATPWRRARRRRGEMREGTAGWKLGGNGLRASKTLQRRRIGTAVYRNQKRHAISVTCILFFNQNAKDRIARPNLVPQLAQLGSVTCSAHSNRPWPTRPRCPGSAPTPLTTRPRVLQPHRHFALALCRSADRIDRIEHHLGAALHLRLDRLQRRIDRAVAVGLAA